MNLRLATPVLLLLSLTLSMGCSQPKEVKQELDPTQQRLMLIGNAYQQFTFTHEKPPSKPEDLKAKLTELGAAEDVWTSPRDNQPFVVIWDIDLRQPPTWAKSTPILAYEKTGKNGSRFVRTVVGSVEELSAQDFAAASFPPGHQPQ